jgi:hypothetical protein
VALRANEFRRNQGQRHSVRQQINICDLEVRTRLAGEHHSSRAKPTDVLMSRGWRTGWDNNDLSVPVKYEMMAGQRDNFCFLQRMGFRDTS